MFSRRWITCSRMERLRTKNSENLYDLHISGLGCLLRNLGRTGRRKGVRLSQDREDRTSLLASAGRRPHDLSQQRRARLQGHRIHRSGSQRRRGRSAQLPQHEAHPLRQVGFPGQRGADRGHFLLDVGRTRRSFTHFVVGRNGDRLQQSSLDNSWTGKWEGQATRINARKWVAEWSVPFRGLGAKPSRGDRWGFQIYREQAATHEVSCWFVSTTDSCDGLRSCEWGDLVFE